MDDPADKPRSGRVVLVVSFLIVVGFGIWGLVSPALLTEASTGVVNYILGTIGWFYLLLTTIFVGLSVWLAFGRYGKLRLGPDDSRPEFSTASWLAMLFAGGMGAGLVFWGVAEPVTHYAFPPGEVEPASAASARQAMVLVNLHWGLHAWAIYAVCSLVLAYFMFRRDMPGLISTPIRATLPAGRGTRILGIGSDLIAVFAVVFGLTGSLVLGVMQVRAGITEVFGIAPTTGVSVIVLGILTAGYLLSASTGLSKGIQLLSNLNMALVILLLLVVLVFGPTSYIFEGFVNSIGDYISALPAFSFRLLSWEGQMDWSSAWTLTFLIWWVAFAPFVGIFIARISRGRTIREFCLGVILIPTLFSMFWFATFGSTAIWIENEAGGGLAEMVREDTATALFGFLDHMPLAGFLRIMALVLIFIFLVTSADSGTFVISMMTSEGRLNPTTRLKLTWGIAIALLTLAVLLSGSLEVAKAMSIFGALPFTLILIIQVVGFLRSLRADPSIKESPRP